MRVRRVWPSRPTFESPFSDYEELRRDMQRLLDSTTSDRFANPGRSGVFPPVNVTQDDDNFYLRAEVPGIEPNELSITALKNRVSLVGRREIRAENERSSYHRKERAEGAFNRTVTLPTEVDTGRVDARCVDGILTLTLPKAEAAKPRQITVRT